MSRESGEASYLQRLQNVIPGGAHTYSKGADQYPENAPVILSHGKGAYVFDKDGNRFLDYGMGLKSVILGYDYDPVSLAAIGAIRQGNNLSKPSLVELNAAEKFISLLPSAEMVKFAKNGSNVTTAAIKMARAFNGKKYVCVPRQQPFFSFDDWFIGSTPITKGIPSENVSLTLRFDYNDIQSLQLLFDQYPGQISAIMLEPATHLSPCPTICDYKEKLSSDCRPCSNRGNNFLVEVKRLCEIHDAILIFDEMRTGFRWHVSGAQQIFGVEPDLSTFGKAIANGFSLAALAGKREIMELAGIDKPGSERTFLLSSTHGAEMSSLAAFMATVDVCETENVPGHLWNYGSKLKQMINSTAKSYGLSSHISAEGPEVSFELITRDETLAESTNYKTLFLQEMTRNQVLMTFIAPSFSHGDAEFEITSAAVDKTMQIYSEALSFGLDKYLIGDSVKPVFRKYN
jgi:glutamate-1-semialdehyde 2,1-aminomutase